MVREYGMSPRLGPVGFVSGSPRYLGGEQVATRTYAEETQRIIDEEVEALLKEAQQRALSLLGDHREALDRLTQDLLVHETVDGDAVQAALEPDRRPASADGPAVDAIVRSR
jgi:cell division protease FtsH